MNFVACTLAAHGPAILDILNEQIRTSTSVYEYVPRTPESMVTWFKIKEHKQYPVIGVEDQAGTIRESGYKFGGWLDLAFYQLTLNTPLRPIDG